MINHLNKAEQATHGLFILKPRPVSLSEQLIAELNRLRLERERAARETAS